MAPVALISMGVFSLKGLSIRSTLVCARAGRERRTARMADGKWRMERCWRMVGNVLMVGIKGKRGVRQHWCFVCRGSPACVHAGLNWASGSIGDLRLRPECGRGVELTVIVVNL